MREGFDRALRNVLIHEGGKVDNPRDPGGRTNQGVTKRTYDAFRTRRGLQSRDVFAMVAQERDAVYREQYWNAVRGDALPPGLDYVLFDGAVNSGPSQSVKWLQRGLGSRYGGQIDGMIGNVTLAAVEAHPNHDALIRAICDRRLAFLKALSTWRTFGNGWSARVAAVKVTGQAWAMGDAGPEVHYVLNGEAKALIEDATPQPNRGVADAITGAGGAQAALAQAADQLTPMAASSEWIARIVTLLTVAGVLCFAGGLLWRAWASRRADERADVLDLSPVNTGTAWDNHRSRAAVA